MQQSWIGNNVSLGCWIANRPAGALAAKPLLRRTFRLARRLLRPRMPLDTGIDGIPILRINNRRKKTNESQPEHPQQGSSPGASHD
jgi:hypothetical protein